MTQGLKPSAVRAVEGFCLCQSIQRAARTISRRFDRALRPLDLTNNQFSLLVALSAGGAPTIGALSEGMAMDRTTVTANLKPLERRRLIEIHTDGRDRRSRRIHLTSAGRRLLARAHGSWKKVHRAELKRLSGIDIQAFRTSLRAVASG